MNWEYTPSCPCRRCEQHRADNMMTVNSYPDGLAETNTKPHAEKLAPGIVSARWQRANGINNR